MHIFFVISAHVKTNPISAFVVILTLDYPFLKFYAFNFKYVFIV